MFLFVEDIRPGERPSGLYRMMLTCPLKGFLENIFSLHPLLSIMLLLGCKTTNQLMTLSSESFTIIIFLSCRGK